MSNEALTVTQGALVAPVSPADHRLGQDNAPVVLVEYGDYECPRCAKLAQAIDEVRARFGDNVQAVFRHFPLTTIHPRAQHAAEAAELVATLGGEKAFWAMHARLFANQHALSDEDLWRYAADLDLDMAVFDREFAAHTLAESIASQKRGGVRSGVNGTPTLFLNGWRYDGPIGALGLTAAIESILAGTPLAGGHV